MPEQKPHKKRIHSRLTDRIPQADLFGGFQVDDKLKLFRLLNRKICGLGTLENLINVSRSPAEQVTRICRVGHSEAGADRLEDRDGNDVFDFNAAGDSTPSAPDTIVGFDRPGASTGDRIDLSGIDANTQVAGNQVFKLGGTGTGTVRFTESSGDTVVLGNTDSDATMEVRIVIDDEGTRATTYTSDDVIL